MARSRTAKAAPDGHTLVMGSSSTLSVNPTLYRKLGYDAIKDFAPVIFVSTAPNALVVHPSVPVDSVKDLVTFAKARPGQLNFASSGTERRIVERLNREVRKILDAPETRERLLAQGAEPGGGTAEEFGNFIRSEIAKWGKVVKAAGLLVD